MANAKEWGLQLDADFVREMGNVRDAVIYLGTEARDRVKRKSPVDTGHFQNNWLVSIGAPDGRTIEFPGSFDAANVAIFDQYPEDGWPAIYVQNNLPYALRLEYGYSKQAPAGMVVLTVAELAALIQGMEI